MKKLDWANVPDEFRVIHEGSMAECNALADIFNNLDSETQLALTLKGHGLGTYYDILDQIEVTAEKLIDTYK